MSIERWLKSLQGKRALLAASLTLLLAPCAWAVDLDSTMTFNISRQPLVTALIEFSKQAQVQVMSSGVQLNQHQAPPISGRYSIGNALHMLLKDSGLEYTSTGPNTIAVTAEQAASETGRSSPTAADTLHLAQANPPSAADQGLAQKQPDQNLGKDSDQQKLEEIIVTAQKRVETINSVPIAVTALTMSQLEDAGVNNVPNLASTVPDLQVHTVGVDSYFGITIRGISNLNYDAATGNPAVSMYIDGVYVDLPLGLADEIYDLSRIEVLRGPQGTLYGRNSTGGNMNIVTADPKSTFGASADASYGNYGDVMTHGMVNLPLSDTLAVRIAGFEHRNDGYFDTGGTTVRNYGAADDWGARMTALWTPSTSFKWRLSLDGFVVDGTPWASIETGPNGLPLDGLSPYHQPTNPDPPPQNYINTKSVRSRMDWTPVDGLTFTYVAGYQHILQDYNWATTGQVGSPNGPEGYLQYIQQRSSGQSHELDATYTAARFSNVLGVTYFKDFITSTGTGVYPIAAIDYISDTPAIVTKRSAGAFDQATFSVLDTLRLTAGVRYSNDHQSQPASNSVICLYSNYPNTTVYQSQFLTATSPGCFPYPIAGGSGSWSKVTWKAGVEYDLNPSTLTYASVTTGYKQGGVQPGLPAAFSPTFAPETVTNYEVGFKTRFLNDSLNLRVAAFYEDYTNIQVFQLISVQGFLALATSNAGAAGIYGTEIESEWNVTPVDRFSGFLTYLHARYTDYVNAIDPRSNAAIASLTGNPLPNAPDYTFRLQYSHDFRLTNGATLTPQAAVYWQSGSYTTAIDVPDYRVKAYSKTDLLLTYTDPTHRWNVAAYGYNMENKVVRIGDYSGSGVVFTDFNPPRTYGLRVAFQF